MAPRLCPSAGQSGLCFILQSFSSDMHVFQSRPRQQADQVDRPCKQQGALSLNGLQVYEWKHRPIGKEALREQCGSTWQGKHLQARDVNLKPLRGRHNAPSIRQRVMEMVMHKAACGSTFSKPFPWRTKASCAGTCQHEPCSHNSQLKSTASTPSRMLHILGSSASVQHAARGSSLLTHSLQAQLSTSPWRRG